MDTGVIVTRVVVHETENCKAEARAGMIDARFG
jgi:hypothetical protein